MTLHDYYVVNNNNQTTDIIQLVEYSKDFGFNVKHGSYYRLMNEYKDRKLYYILGNAFLISSHDVPIKTFEPGCTIGDLIDVLESNIYSTEVYYILKGNTPVAYPANELRNNKTEVFDIHGRMFSLMED